MHKTHKELWKGTASAVPQTAQRKRGFSPGDAFGKLNQTLLKRLLHISLVCAFALTVLGANSPHSSFDKLGHKLVCQCGCGQILLECNHVGCPVSGPMIEELKAQMSSGQPDKGILNWFVTKYGPVVLAAPIRGGFDNVAWIVPFAALLLGTVGVALLIRYWHSRHQDLLPATSSTLPASVSDTVREQIRRDTTYQ